VRRAAFFCYSLLLASTCAFLIELSSCAGFSTGSQTSTTTTSAPDLQGKFQHVVIIVQENRTPDNLFHDPVLMAAGADIASSGVNSSGDTVELAPTPLGTHYDLSHMHSAFVSMYDGGKMDGADKTTIYCDGSAGCPPANPQFMYVQSSDVEPYFQLAEQYTFGDRMFQTNQGPSFPAHQFILSGTSAPTATSNLFAAENTPGAGYTGCAAAPGSLVALIDPSGNESSSTYPCFEHPTLTDRLEANSLSWRYYSPNTGPAGAYWTAPNAIQHMCGPNAPPPNATACTGSDWVNNVIPMTAQNPAPVLTDIANNQLATVSWVMPAGQNSDHAGAPAYIGGPSWVASIVNAIGASSYWSNTAIIITWDDWGGWYDHVAPPRIIRDSKSWGSGYVYGFRVPLIVVSRYTRPAYISHVNHDFGSILNFVEQVFGLPSLGYADARADDLSDCFNFGQAPLQFQTIQAPMTAEHFLNDHTPPADPDDD
jgi:phospholipase C